MRKWFFIFLIFFINIQLAFAQDNLIEVKSSGNNLFIDHKVAAKESLYSLGRLYNVPPKELALYNKLTLNTGLNIGQDLKIPLTQNNFSQTEKMSAGEVLVPVHHILQAHETLFRLSQQYNKVPVDQLKKWNHLQSDAIATGTSLIIGFLKVDKNQSSLASRAFVPLSDATDDKKDKEITKTRAANGTGIAPKEIVGIHEVEKKEEPVIQVEKKVMEVSVTKPADGSVTIAKENAGAREMEKTQNPVQKNENIAEEKIVVPALINQSRIDFAGGTFRKSYELQNHQQTELNTSKAMGSIFKSTSGWQDGKYYCFNNEAGAGTILKIMNKESGKTVYAKVLDVIPDIKQNSGLQIILSNAAADELGVGEKFECEIEQ